MILKKNDIQWMLDTAFFDELHDGANIKFLILVGPSGIGKSSLSRKLATDNKLFFEVRNTTTRSRRQYEMDNIDFNFVTEYKFNQLYQSKQFAWARTGKYPHYGYLKDDVMDAKDKIAILCFHSSGASVLVEYFLNGNLHPEDFYFVFLQGNPYDVLLHSRDKEGLASLKKCEEDQSINAISRNILKSLNVQTLLLNNEYRPEQLERFAIETCTWMTE